MKKKLLFLILFTTLNLFSQQTNKDLVIETFSSKIAVKASNINPFYINHSLYMNAFYVDSIYPNIDTYYLKIISKIVSKNIEKGVCTKFTIPTKNEIPYKLTVFASDTNNQDKIVYLTNYNPTTKTFEEGLKNNYYATSDLIETSVIIEKGYAIPWDKKKELETTNDYISLLQMNIFNGITHKKIINQLLKKAKRRDETNPDDILWIRSYFYLATDNTKKAEKYYKKLVKTVSKRDTLKQLEWKQSMDVLGKEIELLK